MSPRGQTVKLVPSHSGAHGRKKRLLFDVETGLFDWTFSSVWMMLNIHSFFVILSPRARPTRAILSQSLETPMLIPMGVARFCYEIAFSGTAQILSIQLLTHFSQMLHPRVMQHMYLSSLVWEMAWRQNGTKPFPKTMLISLRLRSCCQGTVFSKISY